MENNKSPENVSKNTSENASNNASESAPKILEEKQIFYLAEFREEEAWLSFMHRQGWKFLSTTGRRYKFEACPEEDWVYQLDFKEDGVASDDYIQMFEDQGWEYVFQYMEWFYFRKKREKDADGNQKGPDLSIFSDNQSRIDMCRRIIRRNFLRTIPFYLIFILYNYLVFGTDLFARNGFIGGLLLAVAVGTMMTFLFLIGYFVGQYSRLLKIIRDLENPVQ